MTGDPREQDSDHDPARRDAGREPEAATGAGGDSGSASAAGVTSGAEPGPVPAFVPDPDRARRLLGLRVLLKSMIALAFAVVAFVVLAVFLSDDGEEDTLPGLRIAIGDMASGETRLLDWDGRAVVVHRRTPEEVRLLEEGTLRPKLRDPESAKSEQPDAMRGSFRSESPEWFVAIGLGTDSGCPVRYLAPEIAPFADAPWPGGLVDTCRGSRYDLAGRVYAGQYADRNLVVPPYTVTDDGTLVLG